MRTDPGETVALDRYHVIADVTNPRLSPAERGRLVRQLARGATRSRTAASASIPAPPSIAGCAPTASRASMGSAIGPVGALRMLRVLRRRLTIIA